MRFTSILLLLAIACGDDDGTPMDDAGPPDGGPIDMGPPPDPITFPVEGPVAGAMGEGSFTFGAATAAAQIEDANDESDWWFWTLPTAMGGEGNGEFVGAAVEGYTRQEADVALVTEMGLDAYRFNPSWSRIEPSRDTIDDAAVQHYSDVIDALVAGGVKPMLTVHHFSNPIWADDFRDDGPEGCTPSDTDLCGWHHPEGGPLIIEELAEHARLLAEEYGDRVDEWATINEPVNYILASYGLQIFPPGRNLLLNDFEAFMATVRNFMAAHAAIYDAILEADTVDADGDGVAAHVGLTLSVAEWAPAWRGNPSTRPQDLEAVEKVRYVYHHLVPDSIRDGTFDADLDGEAEETHADWAGKLDFLGVQYYFRAGVTSEPGVVPVLEVTPCFGAFDLGACLDPDDDTHWVPAMGYEYWEPGLYNVLADFSSRWPDLPLTVTESGIATEVGARRAEHVVRSLEQIERARAEGVDVRGYYHWSLMDNFEWAEGYEPRFGLYHVDLDTYSRTATEGATVLGEITGARGMDTAMRSRYGGLGPMTPEGE
ncbi:MAG: family 1 glycosylhydrolase [Deltaproteobacteria bacterium]|nr:family 1 glycosylhydrolase [Deltaproteobacteria bacterium]